MSFFYKLPYFLLYQPVILTPPYEVMTLAKRVSSSLQTSRAELVLWLGCLMSRAEPAQARLSRAEPS
jgi:hypothetical protein